MEPLDPTNKNLEIYSGRARRDSGRGWGLGGDRRGDAGAGGGRGWPSGPGGLPSPPGGGRPLRGVWRRAGRPRAPVCPERRAFSADGRRTGRAWQDAGPGPPKRARVGASPREDVLGALDRWSEAVRASAKLMDGFALPRPGPRPGPRPRPRLRLLLPPPTPCVAGPRCDARALRLTGAPRHPGPRCAGRAVCSKVLAEIARLQDDVRADATPDDADVVLQRAIAECPFPRAFLDMLQTIDAFEGKPLLECVAAAIAVEHRIQAGRQASDESSGLGQGKLEFLAARKEQEVERFKLRVERQHSEQEQLLKGEQLAATRHTADLDAAEKSLREMRAEEGTPANSTPLLLCCESCRVSR